MALDASRLQCKAESDLSWIMSRRAAVATCAVVSSSSRTDKTLKRLFSKFSLFKRLFSSLVVVLVVMTCSFAAAASEASTMFSSISQQRMKDTANAYTRADSIICSISISSVNTRPQPDRNIPRTMIWIIVVVVFMLSGERYNGDLYTGYRVHRNSSRLWRC